MFSYPKLDFNNYEMYVEYYIKKKNSNMFVNLKEISSLNSSGIAHLIVNKRKYDYEWYTGILDNGDLIKEEIIKNYFIGNKIKTKKEINYFMVKKSKNGFDEDVFPLVTGDVLKTTPDFNKQNKK
jgi:hypothetical protein